MNTKRKAAVVWETTDEGDKNKRKRVRILYLKLKEQPQNYVNITREVDNSVELARHRGLETMIKIDRYGHVSKFSSNVLGTFCSYLWREVITVAEGEHITVLKSAEPRNSSFVAYFHYVRSCIGGGAVSLVDLDNPQKSALLPYLPNTNYTDYKSLTLASAGNHLYITGIAWNRNIEVLHMDVSRKKPVWKNTLQYESGRAVQEITFHPLGSWFHEKYLYVISINDNEAKLNKLFDVYLERYDTSTCKWAPCASSPAVFSNSNMSILKAGVAIKNQKHFIFQQNQNPQQYVWLCYDMDTNTWSINSDLLEELTGRTLGPAVQYDGCLAVVVKDLRPIGRDWYFRLWKYNQYSPTQKWSTTEIVVEYGNATGGFDCQLLSA